VASVNLREIAAKCGVSVKTASRILGNNGHLHRPETVKRVLRVAEELRYRPNLLARGVQSGRTRTVGVMLVPDRNGFTSTIMIGIHDALIARDYLPIMLLATGGATEDEQIHRLVDRRVDGMILRADEMRDSDERLSDLLDRNVPVVTVDTQVPGTRRVDFVGTEDDLGGRLAAEHLLALGHRRVAYVSWDFSHRNMRPRCEGFQEAVAQTPGATCACVLFPYEPGEEGWVQAIGALLRSPRRPTAVFLSADTVAPALYRAARQEGLRIPEDLSAVGFADLSFVSYMAPPLTTVRQPTYEIGQQAARMILARIDKKLAEPVVQRVRLCPELVVRGSTAAPPGAPGRRERAG